MATSCPMLGSNEVKETLTKTCIFNEKPIFSTKNLYFLRKKIEPGQNQMSLKSTSFPEELG